MRTPALWFIAGRVVWGVGSSLILVGALAAVMLLSHHGNRGRLTGRVRIAVACAMVLITLPLYRLVRREKAKSTAS